MKLTVRGRIMILLSALVCLFVVAFGVARQIRTAKTDAMFSTEGHQFARFLDGLIEIQGQSLEMGVADYSCWDEMHRFVREPDPEWARENLAPMLKLFDTDVFWVYGTDRMLRYSAVSDRLRQAGVREAPSMRWALGSFDGSARSCHFFAELPFGTSEFRGATIHRTTDRDRQGEPAGYLIAGRVWDDRRLAQLADFAKAEVTLSAPAPDVLLGCAVDSRTGLLTMVKQLPGWDGAAVSFLQIRAKSPLVDLLRRYAQFELLATAVFAVSVLALLFLSVTYWVSRPLKRISRSLHAEDPSLVASLEHDSSEFGQIGSLIRRFFVQRDDLEREVSERENAEERLREMSEDLEARVTLRTAELQDAKRILEAEVTERRLAEEALRVAKDTAEEACRARSLFLANMSHEIRTPMNGIIAMVELALANDMEAQQREYLEIVQKSADALLHIINDILDFSRLEANGLKLEHSAFDLHECLRDSVDTLLLRARKKGLYLDLNVSPEVPQDAAGDLFRFRQILLNLIGNAIKFTEKGGVTVEVTKEDETAEEVVLLVTVADTGIGIPQESQAEVFDAFAQADCSITRRYGGTGLGLAITAQLVRLMGGRISVSYTHLT
ncbi:MAG: ATP-binding protein, partial [Candidatus Eisenbacteria bacterium]|nr:ATP-binding protein [Candidatus Eisenbacteria bacterium]